MTTIIKTLSIHELQLLRRFKGSEDINWFDSKILMGMLQDCTDLKASEIFAMTEDDIVSVFTRLFDESLTVMTMTTNDNIEVGSPIFSTKSELTSTQKIGEVQQ